MQKTVKAIPTAEQIKTLYEHFGTSACHLLEMNGGISPEVFILELDVQTGKLAGMTGLEQDTIRQFLSSSEGKSALGALVGDILNPSSDVHGQIRQQANFVPNVVISINEVWFAAAPVDKNGVIQLNERVSQNPDRQEGIMIMIYSERGPESGLSAINRSPDGKTTAMLGAIQMNQNNQISGLLVPEVFSALSALQASTDIAH